MVAIRSHSLRSIVDERSRRPLLSPPTRQLMMAAAPTAAIKATGAAPPLGRLSAPNGLDALIKQTASIWPEIGPRVAHGVPRVAREFFPTEDSGCSMFLAFAAMQFALETVAAKQENSTVRRTLVEFSAALHDAAVFNINTSRALNNPTKFAQTLDDLVTHYVQEMLKAHSATVFPGGYQNASHDGHAACLVLLPRPDGTTLCAVIDRTRDVIRYPRDGERRPQPIIMLLRTDALTGRPGSVALQRVLKLQYFPSGTHRMHTMRDFDSAIETLRTICNGKILLGYDANNVNHVEAFIPGQSPQKAGTCAISSLLGALHFVLHRQLNTLDLRTHRAAREAAQNVYKQVKQQCRQVILEQALDAWRDADDAHRGDAVEALRDIKAYLEPRVQWERKGAKRLLEQFPAEV